MLYILFPIGIEQNSMQISKIIQSGVAIGVVEFLFSMIKNSGNSYVSNQSDDLGESTGSSCSSPLPSLVSHESTYYSANNSPRSALSSSSEFSSPSEESQLKVFAFGSIFLGLKSCIGYILGQYGTGNNASILKTVSASAVGGIIINVVHCGGDLYAAITKEYLDTAKTAISSALIAYINYEVETHSELEIEIYEEISV